MRKQNCAADDAKAVIRYLCIICRAPHSSAQPFSYQEDKEAVLPFPVNFRKEYDALPYRFVRVAKDPDLILLSVLSGDDAQLFMSALFARWTFGARPLLLTKIGEPMIANPDGYDYVFSSFPPARKGDCENVCLGLGLLDFLGNWHRHKEIAKTKFCNYVYSNDRRPGTKIRRDFCRKLMRYKPVDCPGQSLNNMSFPEQTEPGWIHPFDLKLRFIKDYKFTIAFENTSINGYVTEKISHPLAVGSIPIYHGCPAIADYYNPRAFVNCHDYGNTDDVIDRIREIDNEPKLYEEYRKAPPVLPRHHYYDVPTKMGKAWASIAEAALARRAEKPSFLMRLFARPHKLFCVCRMLCRNPNISLRYAKNILKNIALCIPRRLWRACVRLWSRARQ